uniref:Transposase Tc1-like domain-containing protein n=1 Tax=Octopus bimaculoides TaxID=37653 RepID=A0A0L8GHU3_OCTBM
MNCSIRTIERLRERYNARNSTDESPLSSRPRLTTARKDCHLHDSRCRTGSVGQRNQLSRP